MTSLDCIARECISCAALSVWSLGFLMKRNSLLNLNRLAGETTSYYLNKDSKCVPVLDNIKLTPSQHC